MYIILQGGGNTEEREAAHGRFLHFRLRGYGYAFPGLTQPATRPVAWRHEEFMPQERPEFNPDLPLPQFRITEEDPLQPLALALQMCPAKQRLIYKFLRGIKGALRTNGVKQFSDMVRILVEEAYRLRKSNNRRSLIILEVDKEIERLKAELSKQQGYARANLFALRKFISTPGEVQLKPSCSTANSNCLGRMCIPGWWSSSRNTRRGWREL